MKIDPAKTFFSLLNIFQGALVGVVPIIVPSRLDPVNWALYTAAALMIASGPALMFAGTWGKRIAAGVCLLYWLMGLFGAVLVGMSASYLYGIYGYHGHAAGSLAVVIAVILLIVFWLIPSHELYYLKKQENTK